MNGPVPHDHDRRVLLEVCVDSIAGLEAAERGGAQRIELCSDLEVGGLTPGVELLEAARARTELPLFVMVRPRPGGFVVTPGELVVMAAEIERMMRVGADGIVLGALLSTGSIDVEATGRLVERARPLPVTFHRAFDACPDPEDALEQLMALGIERVLTSGRASTAEEGIALLARLIERAGERIVVMPGGGVRATNVRRIVEATRAHEIHSSARRQERPGVTEEEEVRGIAEAVRGRGRR
jgi:copper homeostasis protein